MRLTGVSVRVRRICPGDGPVAQSFIPPPDLLATFLWLFPKASEERRRQWQFIQASLQANAGERDAARAGFEGLVGELRAAGQSGRLLDEARRGLERVR